MPSPFPGMDPYLEEPGLWPGFHNPFADDIHRILNRQLPEGYYAQVEMRSEVGIERIPPMRTIVPDVTIRETNQTSAAIAIAESDVSVSPYWDVTFDAEPYELASVVIRAAGRDRDIVTVIELLSPSNKRSGTDRKAFLRKRAEILGSRASLVEIDLLRRGRRLWFPPSLTDPPASQPRPDYLVAVNRSWERGGRFRLQLFPGFLREPLPTVAIPLREREPEVRLDLQDCFRQTYDSGPYRRGAVDYARPPRPRLPKEHRAWAAERVSSWLATEYGPD